MKRVIKGRCPFWDTAAFAMFSVSGAPLADTEDLLRASVFAHL